MVKNNLLKIRTERGMRFAYEMAEFLGVDKTSYGRYEKGEKLPTLDRALEIAKKLDLTVEDIWFLD
jgi:DNA-binding XRE family transcriptional regulator